MTELLPPLLEVQDPRFSVLEKAVTRNLVQ